MAREGAQLNAEELDRAQELGALADSAANEALGISGGSVVNKTISGAGLGDVVGPASATDNALVLYDGTSGTLIKDGPALGTSGHVLTSNGAGAAPSFQAGGSGDMVLASVQTNTGAKTFNSGTLIYAGATSGTTTVNATAIAGTTTLTLPAATDTLVGKATTDTFTNKTFDANGTGNSLSNVDVADLANGTDGELITWDAAGAPATVAVGTSGHVLTSNGVGAAPTFQAAAGGGNVSNTGTPVNNQLAVWTDATTIEGDAALTFDTNTDTLAGPAILTGAAAGFTINTSTNGNITLDPGGSGTTTVNAGSGGVTISTDAGNADISLSPHGTGVVNLDASTDLAFNSVAILSDSAGTMTLSNVDAIDATTETTLEAAIDTLSNLTTVGALDAGSITSNFGSIDNGASNITTTGDITGGGILATGDTAAGDSAAMGYTAVEGLILTGQGSTYDVTIKNDADGNVMQIPTGTTTVQMPSLTASEIVITDASKGLVSAAVATYPSLTELTYVKGVTSALQTQIDAKGVGDALTSNPLSQFAATTSAQLAGVISNETGSGALVFGTSPTLVTPALGTPASGVMTNMTGYPGDSSLVTSGALNSGSITSGFGSIDNGASNITTTGDISGGGILATGDTAAGDSAAMGYTATEGLILTGQGSVTDVTIKNDADTTVISIPTGTTTTTLAGALTASSGTITGPSGTWDIGGMDIATSDSYAIAGTDVLTATTLGSAVVNSSLTSVGTLSSGNVDAAVSAASLTVAGKIEIATVAETNTGTDATRAVSPDGLDGWTGSAQVTTVGTLASGDADAIVSASSTTVAGKVELATTAEIDTGTDSTRAMPVDQYVASKRNIRWLVFNLVEAATDCAAATNIAGDFVSPIAGTILQSDTTPFYLYATNSTAGITGTQVVDISIGGTSIMTTNKLDFDTTEKTTTTAATPPDLTTTSLAVGDIITIDIDSVHSGTAAKGLTVYMAVRE